MHDLRTPLRQCLLASLVFVVAALPFHYGCAELFAGTVLNSARSISRLVGPRHVQVLTPTGRAEVDRDRALEDFYADPDQQPRPYGLLVFLSWVAVAPMRPAWRRLGFAAGGTLVLVAVYALARAYDADVWFHTSLTALSVGTPVTTARVNTALIGLLGTLFSVAALVVVPSLLALTAYPGRRMPRAAIPDPR